MIESLKELNKICQKPDYKTKGNWMVRKILRPAALPITWALLHTPVTANQVTTAAILVGLAGNFCLALPGSGWFLTGVLALQLWYLLDHVDGQIARYRKTSGLTGRFYDFTMHHLIHGTILFALGWHLFLLTDRASYIFLGFLGTLGVFFFNMLYDIQYKTFYEKWITAEGISKKELTETGGAPAAAPKSLKKSLISAIHKSLEMHVLMNVLTVAALLEIFAVMQFSLRVMLYFVYSPIAIICCLGKYYLWIKEKRVDNDFNAFFTENQTDRGRTHE